jgi:hypothetical protein
MYVHSMVDFNGDSRGRSDKIAQQVKAGQFVKMNQGTGITNNNWRGFILGRYCLAAYS